MNVGIIKSNSSCKEVAVSFAEAVEKELVRNRDPVVEDFLAGDRLLDEAVKNSDPEDAEALGGPTGLICAGDRGVCDLGRTANSQDHFASNTDNLKAGKRT